MIILKHLTIENFRLLREINLHFPQRGSILIQGPNEAGKSALFESIYFALYGFSLASDHGKRSLDDVILYGARQASVTLTLSVGVTELTITRTLERNQGQKVSLVVRRLGMPEEGPITKLSTANERIIAELGLMNADALRNSCFIEQKGLTRVEDLNGTQREETLRRLLGLEKLRRMTADFKLTPDDEQQLQKSVKRLKLAETQTRIPELSTQLTQLEESLDAVTVISDLAEITQQENDIAEQEEALQQLGKRRNELKALQVRIQQLKKADFTLSEIISSYEAIAEARRELPVIEQQLLELDHREREELPVLEKRVEELADLTHSFGTLERISNDLLTSVSTIKELEEVIKQQQAFQQETEQLEADIAAARQRLDDVQQSLVEVEELRKAGRPQLEARLLRLRDLAEKMQELHRAEEAYAQRIMYQGLAEENSAQLRKIQKDVQDAEQELMQAEVEVQQQQQKTEALEKRWRQLSIRRQLEEWYRLKGLSQGLANAEQQVLAAHEQQARLGEQVSQVKQTQNKWLLVMVASLGISIVIALVALFLIANNSPLGFVLLVLAAIIGFGGGIYGYINYNKAHHDLQIAERQRQEAISQVGAMVAAREAARREGVNHEALARIEHEIISLGGTVPVSREEAQQVIQQVQDQGESLADLQAQVQTMRDNLAAMRGQVHTKREAVNRLQNEERRLLELRKKEGWDDIDARLRSDRIAIEDMQHEIASLAGQEGLPIPTYTAPVSLTGSLPGIPTGSLPGVTLTPFIGTMSSSSTGITTEAELETQLNDAIKATEREIASQGNRIEMLPTIEAEVRVHRDALEVLQQRLNARSEQREYYEKYNPVLQLERAREQQATLRSALQSLQDSLRQRVKPLGVAFGQTAISTAEIAARRQLESLNISLGSRVELQSRREKHARTLKERQDNLSEYYHQLAKLSGSLGSWIVPPNPFAEALATLRTRCQREIEQGNEKGIALELTKLGQQEQALQARIALCREEISNAQERITDMLNRHQRPASEGYQLADLSAAWPLIGEYTLEDGTRLEEERTALEQELRELEQLEAELSTELQTGKERINLEEARQQKEQQERLYETRKRGSQLIQAVDERLLRKMVPRTEYYMQQILPLVTSGRYHDIHLETGPEEGSYSGGPLQLRVWDTAAGEYVAKSALSGGAADQLSLALRLSFAIAALPRELAAAPGFVLLDEPFTSFDRTRTRALVDVITGDILGQHFEQVLFITHSSAFDPALFPYHIYMENGAVVESNLPVVPGLSLLTPLLSEYTETLADGQGNGKSNRHHNDSEDGKETTTSMEETTSVPIES